MTRSRFFTSSAFLVGLCLVSLLLPFGGCKKKAKPRDYGKPTWLTVDPSQLAAMSEYDTTLEKGMIVVTDPEGWDRQARGVVTPPKGFKTVIVFQNDVATIMMNKSVSSKNFGDLDEENIEEFAELAQQLFKSPVRMVKLGEIVGVTLSKRVADSQRISNFLDRRIIATSIDGQIYTFELLVDPARMNDTLLNALYAVAAHTEIKRADSPEAEEDGDVMIAADKPEAATPDPKAEEPLAEIVFIEDDARKVEEAPIPDSDTVAAAPKAPETKPAAKAPPKTGGSASKKGGSTRDMLNELEALLK